MIWDDSLSHCQLSVQRGSCLYVGRNSNSFRFLLTFFPGFVWPVCQVLADDTLHVATWCPVRLRKCISQSEQPLLLYRNNRYLADETDGSQAAILSAGDGLLLGQGGSGDDTVITSRAMTGTQGLSFTHNDTSNPDEAFKNPSTFLNPLDHLLLQQ